MTTTAPCLTCNAALPSDATKCETCADVRRHQDAPLLATSGTKGGIVGDDLLLAKGGMRGGLVGDDTEMT